MTAKRSHDVSNLNIFRMRDIAKNLCDYDAIDSYLHAKNDRNNFKCVFLKIIQYSISNFKMDGSITNTFQYTSNDCYNL